MNKDWVKDEITKRWDYSSQRYDGYHGHGVKSREEAEAWGALFQRFIPGQGLKVLEVGCGTGEMSLLLAGLGHDVQGIDLSARMLAKAREKAEALSRNNGGPKIGFDPGDAEDPPFEDGRFDAVVCRHVLWTLPSPEKAASGWARVLKENGTLLVIDALWNDESLTTRLRQNIGRWLIYLAEKNNLSKDFYSRDLAAALPHSKGLPLDQARVYVQGAGFCDIQTRALGDLAAIQKKHMPWRYKISYNYDYYSVCGKKRSGA
ncbi:MAG: class I SAM-dependent methyltransferase [Pseudomonadota bacterium]